jgi:glycolate dehydrogenase FAD-binding subunit
VSATGVSLDVARELRAICGDENTRERPIGGVYVSPGSAEEVAAVLGFANEHRLSVGPAGGSTEYNAAELRTEIVLHTNRLTQVEHYDHADLTVGVGAGATIAQLNAMVNADNLMFAGDPALPERCTLGGLLATASHGPMRHGFGAVRDYCIGVRFVTGDGRRAKGGGRVVKNVAGYDLMKLLIGSYGTLAVITSASFKLFPAPRQTQTFLAEFATAKEALEFRDRVVRSPLSPICLEVVSPGARKLMRPEMTADAWVMCVRAAGSDAVLARYRKELGSAITRELEGVGEETMWRAVQDFEYADSKEVGGSSAQLVYLSVWPQDVGMVVDTALDTSALGGVDVSLIGRVGVGLMVLRIEAGERNAADSARELIDALRNRFREKIAVKVKGASNPWPITPANLASMRAVKQALDPDNVLRGRQMF